MIQKPEAKKEKIKKFNYIKKNSLWQQLPQAKSKCKQTKYS